MRISSSRRGRIGAAIGVLALASSCGERQLGVIEPNLPPAPPPSLRLEPGEAISNGHDPIAFRAYLDDVPIAASAVSWRIADSALGRISSAGVFEPCFGPGQTTIAAEAAGATTGRTVVRMELPAFALASIQAIRNDDDGRPTDLDRVAGTVLAQVETPELNCRPVAGIRLRIVGAGIDSLLPETRYEPPRGSVAGLSLPWATAAVARDSSAAFPDGEYAVEVRVRYGNGDTADSPAVSLRVRNP